MTLIAGREADKFNLTVRKVILLQASERYVSFRETLVNNPPVVFTTSSFLNINELSTAGYGCSSTETPPIDTCVCALKRGVA